MPEPLVAIVGPTASGKSALALQAANQLNGEIICADSRTVYKGMDIGTAKPTERDQVAIRHHLLDIVGPNQPFNAAAFKQRALAAIKDIETRSKLPILVGGTGLYIDSVLFDYQFGPAADTAFRNQLQLLSRHELESICRQKDIAMPINNSNKRHLMRAIELGGLISQTKTLRDNTIVVGIAAERSRLRKRVEQRVRDMFDRGVLQEAQNLADHYGWDSEAMTGSVYRLAGKVLGGELSKEHAIEECIKSDMQLAKRQMTWFKRNPHIYWSSDPQELLERINAFVTQ